MNPLPIRLATAEDLPAVRAICLATCTDPALLANPKALYLVFADFYLNEEQGHCFVATENGRVVGYILSSFSQKKFAAALKEKYLPLLKKVDPHLCRLQHALLFACHFWPAFPAHLHINIDPAYQQKGIGSRLMENLIAALRASRVKGVYLTVSKSHPQAIRFYRKQGFRTLRNWPRMYVLAKKL